MPNILQEQKRNSRTAMIMPVHGYRVDGKGWDGGRYRIKKHVRTRGELRMEIPRRIPSEVRRETGVKQREMHNCCTSLPL